MRTRVLVSVRKRRRKAKRVREREREKKNKVKDGIRNTNGVEYIPEAGTVHALFLRRNR